MSKPGCFITLEGSEGAGKSTVAESLAERLRRQQIYPVVTREPGGTALGEALRELLLNPDTGRLAVESELLMVFAARAQHLYEVIRPALVRGEWVICDRFTDSSFAYQGGGRQMDFARIEVLERWLHGDLQPNLTLLFDLPVDLGLQRAGSRSPADRFEAENMAFFSAVRGAYLRRADADPDRIAVVDASLSPEQVMAQVLGWVDRLLPTEY